MYKKTIKQKAKYINETNIDNAPIKKTNIKVAILYPNSYYVGITNLGFQGIIHFFLKTQTFHINRFFYDKYNKNKIFSPDKQFNLNQANIILVSQSYETDLFNLIEMLISANMKPLARDRKDIFLGVGGAFPNINPEIFTKIADIVFTGEFEDYIEKLIYNCSLWQKKNKEKFISLFHNIEEYIMYDGKKPLHNTKSTNKKNNNNIINFKPNYSHILTKECSFPNNFLVEITRGCRFNCHFCTVPGIYGKLRTFSKEHIFELVELALTQTNKIGLVSALTTDHKDLIEIINYINKKGGLVSFSSLRIENISDELLYLIRKNKQNNLTIAPEAASKKIKRKIRKIISNDKILALSEKAIRLGFKQLKLYFLIGFVEEDEDDLKEIINLTLEIRKQALSLAKELKYMPEIIVNVNQFIPKPKSPLANEPLINHKIIKAKIAFLKRNLLPVGNIKIRTDSYKENYLQWKISHTKDPSTIINDMGAKNMTYHSEERDKS